MGNKKIIAGAVAQGIGMIHQGVQSHVNHGRQKELMGIQQQNQMKLNEQGSQLQKKMWDETNYGAQMEHIKKAGLNPSLLYGMSGGGGTTTGSQSGGSATGGGVTNAPYMGMEALLLDKQLEVLESQANKNNADADKTRGADTDNTRMDTKLKEITKDLNAQTIENKKQELRNLQETENLTVAQTKVAHQMFNVAVVDEGLKKAGIEKTEAETKSIIGRLSIEWKRLGLENIKVKIDQGKLKVDQGSLSVQQKKVSIEGWNAKIKEFEAEIKAEYPSLSNVTGKAINETYDWIMNNTLWDVAGKIFSGKSYSRDENERSRKVGGKK